MNFNRDRRRIIKAIHLITTLVAGIMFSFPEYVLPAPSKPNFQKSFALSIPSDVKPYHKRYRFIVMRRDDSGRLIPDVQLDGDGKLLSGEDVGLVWDRKSNLMWTKNPNPFMFAQRGYKVFGIIKPFIIVDGLLKKEDTILENFHLYGYEDWDLPRVDDFNNKKTGLLDPLSQKPALPKGHPFGSCDTTTGYWTRDGFCAAPPNHKPTEEKNRNEYLETVQKDYKIIRRKGMVIKFPDGTKFITPYDMVLNEKKGVWERLSEVVRDRETGGGTVKKIPQKKSWACEIYYQIVSIYSKRKPSYLSVNNAAHVWPVREMTQKELAYLEDLGFEILEQE